MANVPFSVLYDQVLPYLPGVEPGIVDVQIRKVLREFMKRTTLYRETFLFSSVPSIPTYRLVPTSGQVSSVIDVWTNDGKTRLHPVPEERRVPAPEGEPTGWFAMIPDLLTLYPQPNRAYPLMVSAALTLSQADTAFPEEVYLQHAELVAAGVVAALMGMPGKPWTQTKAAVQAGQTFGRGVKSIRAALRDGGQPNISTFTGVARFGA